MTKEEMLKLHLDTKSMTTVVMSTTESGAIINYSNSPSMLEDLLFLVRLLDREIDRIIASGDANLN